MSEYILLKNVVKTYGVGKAEIRALDGINLGIEKGEFAVIVGASGAGKTTLLNLIGGMDTLTTGSIVVGGIEIDKLNNRKLVGYRRKDVGFVFQFYNLMPNLTAIENVELVIELCKEKRDAREILREVGLSDRVNNFPAELSGGEQQRVAIARALAKSPKLLLCDEPTGALDYKTGKEILALLHRTCRDRGMTVVVITHNTALKKMADRVIEIKNGKVYSESINTNPVEIDKIEW